MLHDRNHRSHDPGVQSGTHWHTPRSDLGFFNCHKLRSFRWPADSLSHVSWAMGGEKQSPTQASGHKAEGKRDLMSPCSSVPCGSLKSRCFFWFALKPPKNGYPLRETHPCGGLQLTPPFTFIPSSHRLPKMSTRSSSREVRTRLPTSCFFPFSVWSISGEPLNPPDQKRPGKSFSAPISGGPRQDLAGLARVCMAGGVQLTWLAQSPGERIHPA